MFHMDHVYGSRRDLKMSPFKHVRKQPKKRHYRPKLWGNTLPEPEILLSCLEAGTLSNLVFSDEKKFDVQHHVNPQNDRVWSCDGEVGPQRVTWVQGIASVMVWGGHYQICKKSFGFCRTRHQTEPRELPK